MSSAEQRREQIRNKMEKYYRLSKTDSAALSSSVPSASPSEEEFDANTFDPVSYSQQLLREHTIEEIYRCDTSLRREVRALDNALQELVCENYAKFISATDTIKRMETNILDIDTKLHALSSNVEKIALVSRTVDENLKGHRKKIEETVMHNQILRKIRFIVQLPFCLKKTIAEKNYIEAAKQWRLGDKIMLRYSKTQAIARTHKESFLLAQNLYRIQENIISGRDTGSGDQYCTSLKERENVTKAMDVIKILSETSIFDSESKENIEERIKDIVLEEARNSFFKHVDPLIEKINELVSNYDIYSELESCLGQLERKFMIYKETISLVVLSDSMLSEKIADTQLDTLISRVYNAVLNGLSSIINNVINERLEIGEFNTSAVNIGQTILKKCNFALETVNCYVDLVSLNIQKISDESISNQLFQALHDQQEKISKAFVIKMDDVQNEERVLSPLQCLLRAAFFSRACDNFDVSLFLVRRFIGAMGVFYSYLLRAKYFGFSNMSCGPHRVFSLIFTQWIYVYSILRSLFPDNAIVHEDFVLPTTAKITEVRPFMFESQCWLTAAATARDIMDEIIRTFLTVLRWDTQRTSFNVKMFNQLQVDLSFLLQNIAPNASGWLRDTSEFVARINEIGYIAFMRQPEKVSLSDAEVEQMARIDI